MANLAVGDRVLLSDATFSEVFAFGHKIEGGLFNFKRLVTNAGTITLSEGHYIYADGKLTVARDVKRGARLEKLNGASAQVLDVYGIVERGLYNPHTLAGEMIVDGFRTSCFTSAIAVGASNSLLAPLRASFLALGIDVTGTWLHDGVSWRNFGRLAELAQTIVS